MSATVGLVQGGFVDGSGWRGVHDELRADGLDVRVVPHATKCLAAGDTTTRDILDGVKVPVVGSSFANPNDHAGARVDSRHGPARAHFCT
jgi:hypothetical protein